MQARLTRCFSTFGPALVLGGLLALTGCGSTAPHAAVEGKQACLIEGSVMLFGKLVPADDCLEGTGSTKEPLEVLCQTAAQAAANRVKASGGEKPKLTYMKACPAGASATCEGFSGLPLTSHHYRRDANQLQATKDRCLAQGGKWKP
jgi:hypothetical protein